MKFLREGSRGNTKFVKNPCASVMHPDHPNAAENATYLTCVVYIVVDVGDLAIMVTVMWLWLIHSVFRRIFDRSPWHPYKPSLNIANKHQTTLKTHRNSWHEFGSLTKVTWSTLIMVYPGIQNHYPSVQQLPNLDDQKLYDWNLSCS